MNKRKVWFWIIGGVVLVIAGLFVGGLGILAVSPGRAASSMKTRKGALPWRLTPVGNRSRRMGPTRSLGAGNPPMNMYLLVLKASTIDDAFSQAIKVVGFDPGTTRWRPRHHFWRLAGLPANGHRGVDLRAGGPDRGRKCLCNDGQRQTSRVYRSKMQPSWVC